jgi:putative methyltransferase (TIGR04325 family)
VIAVNTKPTIAADFKVWEGIYESFAEAPGTGAGHEGLTWRERAMHAARDALSRLTSGRTLDYSMRQRNVVMSTLVATLLTQRTKVRVLDFGGGVGIGFIVLSSMIGDKIKRVDYRIVDAESTCRTGFELFGGAEAPTFQPSSPAAMDYDIVHAASVLQYIEDWRGAIRMLAEYNAAYLSLGDVFIGDFPTYVTLQNYYDSRLRHWFINRTDFIAEVEAQGYELVLSAPCDAQILGSYGALPMANFPLHLRIAHASHLLFAKPGAPA